MGLYELNNGNSLGRSMNRSDSYQMNLTVSYARQFGKHYVSGLFSIEKAESEWEDLNGSLTDPLPLQMANLVLWIPMQKVLLKL